MRAHIPPDRQHIRPAFIFHTGHRFFSHHADPEPHAHQKGKAPCDLNRMAPTYNSIIPDRDIRSLYHDFHHLLSGTYQIDTCRYQYHLMGGSDHTGEYFPVY